MKIGIDMMGGDFAPDEIISGIKSYLEEDKAHLVLLGDEKKLAPLLLLHLAADNYTLVHTPQIIDMHDHPTRALKEKPKSSIAVGFHLLATGETDAFISAGNTGAMLVGAVLVIKTIPGILRPCIS